MNPDCALPIINEAGTLPIIHQLAYYFSGLTLGAFSVFIGFRAYYKDLYRIKP